jgi:hypothetical protein
MTESTDIALKATDSSATSTELHRTGDGVMPTTPSSATPGSVQPVAATGRAMMIALIALTFSTACAVSTSVSILDPSRLARITRMPSRITQDTMPDFKGSILVMTLFDVCDEINLAAIRGLVTSKAPAPAFKHHAGICQV